MRTEFCPHCENANSDNSLEKESSWYDAWGDAYHYRATYRCKNCGKPYLHAKVYWIYSEDITPIYDDPTGE